MSKLYLNGNKTVSDRLKNIQNRKIIGQFKEFI